MNEEKTETRTQYVIRRAREVKRFRESAAAAGVGYEWLCKLAGKKSIKGPGADPIDKCFQYYKRLEAEQAAQLERAAQAALQPELQLAGAPTT